MHLLNSLTYVLTIPDVSPFLIDFSTNTPVYTRCIILQLNYAEECTLYIYLFMSIIIFSPIRQVWYLTQVIVRDLIFSVKF